jgi:hypothetical protein
MKFLNLILYLVRGKEELAVRVECKAVDVSAVTGQLLHRGKCEDDLRDRLPEWQNFKTTKSPFFLDKIKPGPPYRW